MIPVVWLPQAELDVVTIYASLYVHNPLAAERVASRLEQKVLLLARHSKIGVERTDIRPALRMLSASPYLIFYHIVPGPKDETEEVHLLRIIDGRRDLSDMF